MGSFIVMRMSEEQKQEILDAKDGEIFCTADKMGQFYEGRVHVKRGTEGVSGCVARTGAIYNDDAEALDNAEAIVKEVIAFVEETPEMEVVRKAEEKAAKAKKKKGDDAKKKKDKKSDSEKKKKPAKQKIKK